MKTLYLLRHAKSSWQFSLPDHDRPLNERGIKDCQIVQKHYLKELKQVDAVFCSTANRAKTTLKLLSNNQLNQISFESSLYTFDFREVTNKLKTIDNQLNQILFVGHNPAYHDLVRYFTNQYLDNFATCGLAKIVFNTKHWHEITKGTLIFYWKPKNFK